MSKLKWMRINLRSLRLRSKWRYQISGSTSWPGLVATINSIRLAPIMNLSLSHSASGSRKCASNKMAFWRWSFLMKSIHNSGKRLKEQLPQISLDLTSYQRTQVTPFFMAISVSDSLSQIFMTRIGRVLVISVFLGSCQDHQLLRLS